MSPAAHDLHPVAMTEEERLAKRRFEAYFVFEMMPDPWAECDPRCVGRDDCVVATTCKAKR